MGARVGRWKYVRMGGREFLFDLSTDIGEKNDLSTSHPDQFMAMKAAFAGWLETMGATEPRGPFQRLRWFCADGTVHPPRPYPCAERGGGVQHGEHSERVKTMRDDGFLVATVLANIDAAAELDRNDFIPERPDSGRAIPHPGR